MAHLWQDTLSWALSSIGLEEQGGSPALRPRFERGSSWAFTDTTEACGAQSKEATAIARDTSGSPTVRTRRTQAKHFVAESDFDSNSLISVAAGSLDSEVRLSRRHDFQGLTPHSSECFDKPPSILRDLHQGRNNSVSFPRAVPASTNFADVIAHLKSEARRCDNTVWFAIAQVRRAKACASRIACHLDKRP